MAAPYFDFVVIGTKRGGTTTLFRPPDHPQVLPLYPKAQKDLKSPHYFDLNYGRGLRWYRSHFPPNSTGDRTPVPRLVGEASRTTCSIRSARHGWPRNCDARLLVLLRNPVDRARTTGTAEERL